MYSHQNRIASLNHRIARIEKQAMFLEALKKSVRSVLNLFGKAGVAILAPASKKDIKRRARKIMSDPAFMESVEKAPRRTSLDKLVSYFRHAFRANPQIKAYLILAVIIACLFVVFPKASVALIVLAIANILASDSDEDMEKKRSADIDFRARNYILNQNNK